MGTKRKKEAPVEQMPDTKVDFHARRLELMHTWQRIMKLCSNTITALEEGLMEMKASLLKSLTETMKLALQLADEFEDIQTNQEFMEQKQEMEELALPTFED